MNAEEKKFLDEQIARIKKEAPHVSDAMITEGIELFKEQEKVIEDCLKEVNRSIANAVKIGQNLNFPPEPFLVMLSEKLVRNSNRFQKDICHTVLESLIDAKKQIYMMKRN